MVTDSWLTVAIADSDSYFQDSRSVGSCWDTSRGVESSTGWGRSRCGSAGVTGQEGARGW